MRLITKIKSLVMGILDKQNQRKKEKQSKQIKNTLTQLTNHELKYLLQLISKSDFKGADLQIILAYKVHH